MVATRRNRRRSPVHPPTRLLRVSALLVALCLAISACGGSSTDDEASGEDATNEPEATDVELFEIPSPEPSPTETPADEEDDATDADPADDEDAADDEADADPEPEPSGPAVWRHVEGFDLVFANGRPDLVAAVDTFYAVGGGDINVSVENILDGIDHERTWQDAADAAVATFPEGLGEASGVFALLSTQWAVIGCESHWAGMNQGTWNTHLFDHLVAEASGLPADQADNQAGILLTATNAAIETLCPRLLPA